MKNAVYANTVDTREQLWQRIQDAANELCTTPGVFESVGASLRHADAHVHAHGGHFEHCVTITSSHCQSFRISDLLEHYTLEFLSPVTFYRSISGPMFIVPF
jgi:hypothetical protein